jgi:hypothetical protein
MRKQSSNNPWYRGSRKLCCVLHLQNDTNAYTHAQSPVKLRGVKKQAKILSEEGAREEIN